MGLTKVWNDNVHPHTERYKGKMITIAPKSFVEMEYDDAVIFRGQYTPIRVDGAGAPLPTSFKMIRLEHAPQGAKLDEIICQGCGEKQGSLQALTDHIKAKHLDQLVDDEAKEEILGKKSAKK